MRRNKLNFLLSLLVVGVGGAVVLALLIGAFSLVTVFLVGALMVFLIGAIVVPVLQIINKYK